MWETIERLAFMALGGLMVHISWLHAWRMYKSGKKEGRGMLESENDQKPRQSVMITNRRSR